jgi:hypothetical protein
MAMTTAERQRAFRRRQIERIAALEAENERLRFDLAAAQAEAGVLSAAACKHPAGAVDGGTCGACGTEVW